MKIYRRWILFISIVFFFCSAIFLTGCFSSSDKPGPEAVPAVTSSQGEDVSKEEEKVFTLEELEKYNGKDGNPAYIAVDGKVYDVTKSSAWKNGMHKNYSAGNDFTEEIKNESSHGVKVLEDLPVVGKIVKE